MRRRLCCAYNVSRGRAEIGRLEAMQAVDVGVASGSRRPDSEYQPAVEWYYKTQLVFSGFRI